MTVDVNTGSQTADASTATTPTKTYLITGGAGFLGINLIRYLLARGQQVVSLDIADFTYPERNQVTLLKGDIRKPADLTRAMQGVDIVIHTAAALPLYSAADIYSTDIDGIRNVLQAAYEQKVERAVHISSTAVYGIPDHHPLYETDRLDGVGPYGEAKVKAEEICQEYRDKGMCIPIIRPKSFVGPERLGVFALFTIGPKTARISRCSAAGTIVINCWMLKICAPPSIWSRRATAPRSTMSSTLAQKNLRPSKRITKRSWTMLVLASTLSPFPLRPRFGPCVSWKNYTSRRSIVGFMRQ